MSLLRVSRPEFYPGTRSFGSRNLGIYIGHQSCGIWLGRLWIEAARCYPVDAEADGIELYLYLKRDE